MIKGILETISKAIYSNNRHNGSQDGGENSSSVFSPQGHPTATPTGSNNVAKDKGSHQNINSHVMIWFLFFILIIYWLFFFFFLLHKKFQHFCALLYELSYVWKLWTMDIVVTSRDLKVIADTWIEKGATVKNDVVWSIVVMHRCGNRWSHSDGWRWWLW